MSLSEAVERGLTYCGFLAGFAKTFPIQRDDGLLQARELWWHVDERFCMMMMMSRTLSALRIQCLADGLDGLRCHSFRDTLTFSAGIHAISACSVRLKCSRSVCNCLPN
jgi:hypothetical protein